MRAILVSDLHLQGRSPVARSSEEDWFAAMARPLKELTELTKCYDPTVAVVYAGDIFDRWNAPPEVVNFALEHMPPGYAVPGQHDLPNHNYGELKRTAYWTLVEAKLIFNLLPGEATHLSKGLVAYGFPWGYPPKPIEEKHPAAQLNLAVVHAFIYNAKVNSYTGAPTTARASVARSSLVGFDAAAYGDNHKGFIDTNTGLTICNCGGFMRRKTDERDYRPGVGLLHGDGTVTRHYFDTSEDSFIELTKGEEQVAKLLDMGAFVRELANLGADDALEFEGVLRRFLDENKIEAGVREIVLEAVTGD